MLDERAEQGDGTLAERERLGAAEQHQRFRVKAEWAERVSLCHS